MLPLPRRKPYFFVLLLLAMASLTARAQVHPLDMVHQPLRVPGLPIYILKVVDGRFGRPPLGIVYRNDPAGYATGRSGSSGEVAQAVVFGGGLETALTEWLQLKMPQRPSDRVLALCIRYLTVADDTKGSALGIRYTNATLVADVYLRRADGYHFVRQIASKTDGQTLNINRAPSALVALMFQQSLLQLAGTDWDQAPQAQALTLAQLPRYTPAVQARPAALRAAAPRPGVYRSFEQFLANRPDTSAWLRADTLRSNAKGWEGTVRLRGPAFERSGKRLPKQEVWGYSDGSQAYVRHLNTYRALTRQGDLFTFVGPKPPVAFVAPNYNETGRVTSYSEVEASSLTDLDDNSNPPAVFALDMLSGQPQPYPPVGQPQRADTAFVYVYRPLGGPAEARRVLYNDREVGQLRPGQYLELSSPVLGRLVRLSIDTPGGPALLFVPNAGTANYVRLQPGSTLTPWQYVPPRQGEAEVDALEKPRQ